MNKKAQITVIELSLLFLLVTYLKLYHFIKNLQMVDFYTGVKWLETPINSVVLRLLSIISFSSSPFSFC